MMRATQPRPPASAVTTHLGAIAKLIVGPIVLALLLRTVGLSRLEATVREAQPPMLALALVAYLGTVCLRGYRWQILLAAQGIAAPLSRLIYLDFVGSFFNMVLPTSVGGDVVKFYELARDLRDGEARIASSLLADRACGLLVLLLMGAALLPLAAGRVALGSAVLILAAAGASLLALPLLLRPRLRAWAVGAVPGMAWLLRRRGVQGLYATLDGYTGRVLAHAALASLLFNGLMILVNVALGLAFGLHLPLPLYAVVVPLVSLLLALPLSVNGLGVRESGYLFFWGQAGVAPTTALSLSLAYYGCTAVAGLMGGLLYLAANLSSLATPTREP